MRVVFGDVVQLPLVAVDNIGQFACGQIPGRSERGGVGHPSVVVNPAVASHLEILRRPRGRRLGIGKRVSHAHTFDRSLGNAVDRLRRLDPCDFKNRRHDIDDMVELGANSTDVLDMPGP